LKLPEFLKNRHMNVTRLSALYTGRLYSQDIPLVLTFIKRMSRPQGHSVAGRIKSMKNPNDHSGIEPATFRLVEQWLNLITGPNTFHSCSAATDNMPAHTSPCSLSAFFFLFLFFLWLHYPRTSAYPVALLHPSLSCATRL